MFGPSWFSRCRERFADHNGRKVFKNGRKYSLETSVMGVRLFARGFAGGAYRFLRRRSECGSEAPAFDDDQRQLFIDGLALSSCAQILGMEEDKVKRLVGVAILQLYHAITAAENTSLDFSIEIPEVMISPPSRGKPLS